MTISITRFDSFEFFTVDYGYSKSFVCDAYYTSWVMHIVVNLQIKCYLPKEYISKEVCGSMMISYVLLLSRNV